MIEWSLRREGREWKEGEKKEGGITNKLYESRREPRARETAAEEEEDRQQLAATLGHMTNYC